MLSLKVLDNVFLSRFLPDGIKILTHKEENPEWSGIL